MKTLLLIVLVIVLLVAAAIVVYHEAEIHELHKTRAAFVHYLDAHKQTSKKLSEIIDEILRSEEERIKDNIV